MKSNGFVESFGFNIERRSVCQPLLDIVKPMCYLRRNIFSKFKKCLIESMNTLSKLKEKERATRKKIIINAARKVFEKKTYESASMAEIAKIAGMAKSSIYTYFKNQESLYIEVAFLDGTHYVQDLKKALSKKPSNTLHVTIEHFLDYYIRHKAKWRMITHLALHGKTNTNTLEKLNLVSRQLMDQLQSVFDELKYPGDTRILAHTLFSSLSGIMIAFRNYPGRSEKERIAHMKRIAAVVEDMMVSLNSTPNQKSVNNM